MSSKFFSMITLTFSLIRSINLTQICLFVLICFPIYVHAHICVCV